MSTREINFDAIVGPMHSYAGLAFGNLASQRHRNTISNPRQAALEGLAKMKLLADLGIPQAVLPPHDRPDIEVLRRVGFAGDDMQVLNAAYRADPGLLAAASSASAMWAANAATVSPSADSADGRVHFIPANLVSQLHRSIEAQTTSMILRAIFRDESHFAHHAPLPACAPLADEGAANHTRLATTYGEPGIELFVYGRDAGSAGVPRRFPARQTLAASQAVARLHQLDPRRTLFVRQNPDAIDAGVFHNDVICVGNENVLLLHEKAFAEGVGDVERISRAFRETTGRPLCVVQIPDSQLSLQDAVDTYLFNSQLVTLPDGSGMMLIAPIEARDHAAARACVEGIIADASNPISSASWADVRQSMKNGGGPACLRLRVVLTEAEIGAAHPGVFLNGRLYAELIGWVTKHYRESLSPDDLADPALLRESRDALEELTRILVLGSVYQFQATAIRSM